MFGDQDIPWNMHGGLECNLLSKFNILEVKMLPEKFVHQSRNQARGQAVFLTLRITMTVSQDKWTKGRNIVEATWQEWKASSD